MFHQMDIQALNSHTFNNKVIITVIEPSTLNAPQHYTCYIIFTMDCRNLKETSNQSLALPLYFACSCIGLPMRLNFTGV